MSPKVGMEPVRQAQIIEAALNLIASNGSHNVSIQDVATEAGLSKGAVLHYYPTKDKLFAATFREYFRRMFELCRDGMAQHDDPLGKMKSIGDLLFNEDSQFGTGYPLYLECMARAIYEETFHRLFHDWVTGWINLLMGAIEEGMEKGDFRKVNAEETARAISAFCQGLISRWYLDREKHMAEWARDTLKDYAESLLIGEESAKKRREGGVIQQDFAE